MTGTVASVTVGNSQDGLLGWFVAAVQSAECGAHAAIERGERGRAACAQSSAASGLGGEAPFSV